MTSATSDNDSYAAPSPGKPVMRGYLHFGAAIAMVVGTGILLFLSANDPAKQISLLIYGASCVVLFGMSALYHIINWNPRQRALLRRLDHANIFLLIAGTYTPVAFNLMTAGWRVGILVAVWALAVIGIATVAPALRLPRGFVAGLYIATGWIALAAIPEIFAQHGWGALLMLLTGGLLYTAGALAYALKRPRLWPHVFGYHELFHLGTIAANAVFFAFMLVFVLPAVRH